MAPLAELFGARSLTLLGGLLAFLTLVLVAFSTSVISFTLVYSILGGKMRAFLVTLGEMPRFTRITVVILVWDGSSLNVLLILLIILNTP